MHAGIFPHYLLPIARLAVPLFFLMTSYFFHLKLTEANDEVQRRQRLVKYIKRNLQLYLFWSIILLPTIIMFHLSWFRNGMVSALLSFMKSFFLTGIFPASWFILAAVVSILIIYFLSKHLNNGWLLLISFIVYIPALLDSNYGGLLSDETRTIITKLDISFYKSFSAALIWVSIGKILAEKNWIISGKFLYPAIVVSLLLLYTEFGIIEHFKWSFHTDCFLMSIPLVSLLFIAIGRCSDIQCKYAMWFRKSSIIIYCLHFTIIRLINNVFEYLCIAMPKLAVFFISLLICLLSAYIIIVCCERKGIKVLRYAY